MRRTILITGCSSGFGAAAARAFAASGWNVVATARRPEDAAALAGEPNTMVQRLDVQDIASIEAAIATGIARFGAIDGVVNNAGFGLLGLFEETSPDKVQEQFAVNLFGAMAVIRAVLPHFRARRSRVIVNVSSGAGVFALPMISLYTASKFALEGFSESLAYELAGLGIRVKIVEPGGVTSTRFGERSASEAGAAARLPDYAPFLEQAEAMFGRLRVQRGRATMEEVAAVIVAAAEDPGERLRYIATDDIRPMIALRHEASEEAYLLSLIHI